MATSSHSSSTEQPASDAASAPRMRCATAACMSSHRSSPDTRLMCPTAAAAKSHTPRGLASSPTGSSSNSFTWSACVWCHM
jgi:hypothetical protein